ncbi:MAG: hypothetical protein ACYTDT_04370 [Planctomycetota bacterium]|jgi:hypothetical protein
MYKWLLIATLALCALPVTAAGKLRKGSEAPDFSAGGRIINPPEFARELDDCEGKVVVIVEWNRRDGSKDYLEPLQPLWKKYGGHALMIFAVHRLKDTEWKVRTWLRDHSITFPVCMGYFYDEKNEFGDYSAESGKFAACVVGIDQKVAYWNTSGSPAKVAQRLLDEIEYKGLQKQDYTKAANDAAAAFSSKKYGRAMNLSKKVMDGEFTEQDKEDAEYVYDRASALADARQDRVDEAKEDGRLDLMKSNLEANKSDFAGHEVSEKAKDALKALKKDKSLKRERDAFEDLEKLKRKNAGKEPLTQANGLRAFAKALKGTKAAEVAKKLAANIDSWHDDM